MDDIKWKKMCFLVIKLNEWSKNTWKYKVAENVKYSSHVPLFALEQSNWVNVLCYIPSLGIPTNLLKRQF